MPRNININIDERNFNPVYFKYRDCETRTQIFYGGSSSGKSVWKGQQVVIDLLKGDRNYLIIRNVSNTIRTSVYNEILKVIKSFNIENLFDVNKTEMSITCNLNGHQAIMKGLDDVQKIKSITPIEGIFTDIWIEEATETKETDVKELRKRLRGPSKVKKRITLTFNPINKTHWIYHKYFKKIGFSDTDKVYHDENLLILKTTYKDNKFLESDDIAELENEDDTYYYNVYTLGNWGVLGDLIFTNWKTEDLSGMRKRFDQHKNGLDFGFTNDPTAFVRTHRKLHRGQEEGKNSRYLGQLFITDAFYEYGLTNPEIAVRLKPLIHKERIRCDSAEPKSIKELKIEGITAIGAIKGQGSVNFGIQWMKQHEIIIEKTLQDIINEFSVYQWRKNKDGIVLNEPVDRDNHGIDATRYAWSGVLFEDRETISRPLQFSI